MIGGKGGIYQGSALIVPRFKKFASPGTRETQTIILIEIPEMCGNRNKNGPEPKTERAQWNVGWGRS